MNCSFHKKTRVKRTNKYAKTLNFSTFSWSRNLGQYLGYIFSSENSKKV